MSTCARRLLRYAGALACSVLAALAPASAAVVDRTGPRAAEVALAACDQRLKDDPSARTAADCYQSVARAHGTQVPVLRRVRALVEEQPNNATLLLLWARLLADHSQPGVEPVLRRAIAAATQAGDRTIEVASRCRLAGILLLDGDVPRATSELREAERRAEGIEAPLIGALLASSRAQLALAASQFRQAEIELERFGDPQLGALPVWIAGELLQARGSALWGQGRRREAMDAFEERLRRVRAGGDRFAEASALHNVAVQRSQLGGGISDEVRQLVRETLTVARLSGNRRAEAAALLSMCQDRSRPLAERIRLAEEGLSVLRTTQDFDSTCFALRELGRVLVDAGPRHFDRGEALVAEAIARARERESPFHLARGLVRQATDRWVMGRRALALESALAALDAIERIRDLQADHLARARVVGEWSFFYSRIIANLLEPSAADAPPNDRAQAFRIAERLRARVLLDEMDAAGATARLAPDEPRHAEYQKIFEGIATLRLDLQRFGADQHRLRAELRNLETRATELREWLAERNPAFGNVWRSRFPEVADVIAALRPDQALLAYHVSPRHSSDPVGSWAFVFTRSGMSVVKLPLDDASRAAIELLPDAVARRDGTERAALRRLYERVVRDAIAPLGSAVRQLIIVPDGELHALPFDALLDAEGRPLASRYAISVTPSVALWLHWRATPAPVRPAALAIADPAPLVDAARREHSLPRLPHARLEVRQLVRRFPSAGTVWSGDESSEARFKAAPLQRFGVLHFATHAVIDSRHPERSGVLLGRAQRQLGRAVAADEDGWLRPSEIVQLPLSGHLVVLAACRSSQGEQVSGEGVLGLARAFFVGGAEGVIGSLWPVRDDEARTMMDRFYRRLAEGQTLAEAMSGARRELFASGAPTAAWAGYVALGADDLRLAHATGS